MIRPKLKGFTESVSEFYSAAKKGKILRLGIQIETPLCNWNCPYCYADTTPNQTVVKAAPIEQMFDWIDQGINLGATGLTVNGTFEPTMGKDMFKVLEYSTRSGLNTMLVTNSTGITVNKAKKLRELDISVLIKLNVPITFEDDPFFEEYKKIQGFMSGGSERIYQMILKKLKILQNEGFNTPMPGNVTSLGVESVIVKPNLKYLRILSRQLRDMNIYTHFEVVKVQGNCKKNANLAPNPKELKELFFGILQDDLKDGYEEFKPHPPYVGGTCYQNLIRLNIAANGDVRPCPGIDLKFGNLTENSMETIIKNSDILNIIRNLDERIEGDCKTCKYMLERECYAGCRGMAFQEMKKKGYSDYKALVSSDPSCWNVTCQ